MAPVKLNALFLDRIAVLRTVRRSVTLVSPAKTAEPIEVPFGLRTWVGPRDHVLAGGSDPPGEGGNFFRPVSGPGSRDLIWGSSSPGSRKNSNFPVSLSPVILFRQPYSRLRPSSPVCPFVAWTVYENTVYCWQKITHEETFYGFTLLSYFGATSRHLGLMFNVPIMHVC